MKDLGEGERPRCGEVSRGAVMEGGWLAGVGKIMVGRGAYSLAKTPLKAAQAPLAAARASHGVVPLRGLGEVSVGGSVSLSSGDWTPRSGSADMLTWLAMGDAEAGSGRRMLRRMGLGLAIRKCIGKVLCVYWSRTRW